MKKGFTLIELLAVIVILAIIALIATPIVLNIINETKESANLRSAEMYLDAVEQSIARGMLQNKYITDGTYNITKDGDICLENFDNTNRTCPDMNTLKVEVEGEKPDKGNIAIVNGNIDGASLELGNKTLGKSGNGGIAPVCTLSSDSDKKGTQLGAKYDCEVRPGEKQIFYILSTEEDGSTNLIMDSNINKSGVAIKSDEIAEVDSGLVEWINKDDYKTVGGTRWGEGLDDHKYGPITAMNYLEIATSSWTNLTNMLIDKFDDDNGNIYNMGKTYNVYARLPYKSEVNEVGCEYGNMLTCPVWMVDYLSASFVETGIKDYPQYPLNNVDGYWTLSIKYGELDGAYMVEFVGYVMLFLIDDYLGVRPVINVKL